MTIQKSRFSSEAAPQPAGSQDEAGLAGMMDSIHRTASTFRRLPIFAIGLYEDARGGTILPATAKSVAGRGNPELNSAPTHALAWFFVGTRSPLLGALLADLVGGVCCVMVARAGQLSGWPVSFRAGIPTPVWATTHERRNSGGSVTRYLKEVAIMATVPALSHPEFTFVFLAVRRTDRDARPRPVRVIADCEHAARLKLATEFILSFAARIPVKSAGEVVA